MKMIGKYALGAAMVGAFLMAGCSLTPEQIEGNWIWQEPSTEVTNCDGNDITEELAGKTITFEPGGDMADLMVDPDGEGCQALLDLDGNDFTAAGTVGCSGELGDFNYVITDATVWEFNDGMIDVSGVRQTDYVSNSGSSLDYSCITTFSGTLLKEG